MTFLSTFLIVVGLLSPTNTFAHISLNMGLEEPDPNMPAIPQEYTDLPIADAATQRMALEMETADCEKLNALNDEVKHAFMLVNIFMQRPGSLSKIIGPDCQFLGEVEEIAAIEDDSLTLTGRREMLYYLPDMNVIFVSHKEKDSIAYGFLREDDETPDPLEYFLEHRADAMRSADTAKSLSITIGELMPPALSQDSRPRIAPTTDIPSSITPPRDTQQPPEITEPTPIEPDFPDVIYTDIPEEEAPADIQPIGPSRDQVPEQSSTGIGYWILGIFLALVLIVTAVIVLKNRSRPEKGYIDD